MNWLADLRLVWDRNLAVLTAILFLALWAVVYLVGVLEDSRRLAIHECLTHHSQDTCLSNL